MYRGRLVQLGAHQREYLPKFVEWMNDWEVRRFLNPAAALPLSLEDETKWFEEGRRAEGSYLFAILTLAENKLIGSCGLHKVDLKNRSGVFGIFIGDKAYWSKGYGTDATLALLGFAFGELGLHRVELEVNDFNPRAVRAYEKAGFRRDGVERQSLYREGKFHDTFLMSILREEWDAIESRGRPE
ncbi:MAG: GNAT family N-acetyltransferase [Chloroflexi bacterium]|nr:GNAT family N-acetyltransferase [Chloroflexota bacterium]